MMQTIWIPSGPHRVFARQWGQNKPLLIALPGFGHDGTQVEPMAEILAGQYTLLAIDLPFHGQTKWEGTYFTHRDMVQLIRDIVLHYQVDHVSLMGHSLGGRIITCIAPMLAGQIDQLILLGPAGIGRHQLIYPRALQRLLERSLQWPGWFKWVVTQGYRWGLISTFHKRYAEKQLIPAKARFRLFRTWNSLPGFRVESKGVQRAFLATSASVRLALGEKDRIIPNQRVSAYYRSHPDFAEAYFDEGHELMTEEVAEWIVNGK